LIRACSSNSRGKLRPGSFPRPAGARPCLSKCRALRRDILSRCVARKHFLNTPKPESTHFHQVPLKSEKKDHYVLSGFGGAFLLCNILHTFLYFVKLLTLLTLKSSHHFATRPFFYILDFYIFLYLLLNQQHLPFPSPLFGAISKAYTLTEEHTPMTDNAKTHCFSANFPKNQPSIDQELALEAEMLSRGKARFQHKVLSGV
jgi:hypothetical protein